jgi:hypothetical protein
MMSNGNHGALEYTITKEIKMTKQEPVAKIVVYQENYSYAYGFRFYSKEGKILLEVGSKFVHPTELVLEEGERVLGIRSRLNNTGSGPSHNDLQFVLGKM